MPIPPIEKACIRCGKHFVGRKNKVFCSEICRSETGNERLMNAYRAQRGTPDKHNKVNYTNNNPSNNKDKSDNSINVNSLIAENKRLSQELAQLKQALAAQTAPLPHSNTSEHTNPSDSPESLKAAKIAAMKVKLAQATVLLEKEAADRALAERIAVAKVKGKELIDRFNAEDEAKAKELKSKLEKVKINPTKKKKP